MTNAESEPRGAVGRRTILRGAAWSAPVVAAAIATPLAAASGEVLEQAQVTGSTTGMLALNILDSASVISATALVTVPTELTVQSGSRAITAENVTVTVTVGRPAGINIPVGRARGFGVYSFDGVQTPAGQRSAVYQSQPIIGQYGFPLTTWTGVRALTIPQNGSLAVPIVFGLAGTSTGVAISALATFPVTVSLLFADAHTVTATSSISVPVGAGIL